MGDFSQPRTTHLTRAIALGTGFTVLLGLAGLAGASPAQAAAKPAASAKVWVKKNSYGKFDLTWKKARKATHYKVIVARDAAMKQVIFTKRTNKLHSWVLDPDVKEGGKYYYRVRSYNGKKAGGVSKVGAVRTKVQPVGRPEHVVVKPAGTSSVTVRWEAAKRATGYTVKLRRTATGTPFWTKRTTARSMTVSGLTKKSFFVTVTADRFKGTHTDSRTVYGATALATPATGRAFTAKVGSYNVMHYTNRSAERPWSSRRAKAASLIDDLDVVGIQESTWGQVVGAMSGLSSTQAKRPIAQLAKLSGLSLAWNPSTDKPCSLHSVHVLYRSSKFALKSCGEKALSYDNRYMTWTVLEDKGSAHGRVLVVNTHRMNGASANHQRAVEARQIIDQIAKINTTGLPVIVTGDLNSWHGRVSTTPLSLLVSAGYHPADLVSPVLVNGLYGSAHDFKPTLKNSIRIDHIFTSDKVLTSRFELRKTNESTAPSDHHPVAAYVSVYK
jgi:endonuclease/exonuclease/phosphatase family metal-dependent hydrolase